MDDLYKVLGIDRTADFFAIKKAYRQSAMECHPDLNPENYNKDKWDKLVQAYEILINPETRQAYDDVGYIPDVSENIERVALTFLRDFINRLINKNGENVLNINIVSELDSVCDSNIKVSQGEIAGLERKKKLLNRVFKKLKKKKDANIKKDFIIMIYNEELENIKTNMFAHYNNIEVFKMLKRFINNYEIDLVKYLTPE